jgi:hypothetical protein
MDAYRTDLRLPPLERARLRSRGTIFASRAVNRLFTQLQGQALSATLIGRPKNEGERLVGRLQVGKAFDALEAQVRNEMGADEIEPMCCFATHLSFGSSLVAHASRDFLPLIQVPRYLSRGGCAGMGAVNSQLRKRMCAARLGSNGAFETNGSQDDTRPKVPLTQTQPGRRLAAGVGGKHTGARCGDVHLSAFKKG